MLLRDRPTDWKERENMNSESGEREREREGETGPIYITFLRSSRSRLELDSGRVTSREYILKKKRRSSSREKGGGGSIQPKQQNLVNRLLACVWPVT